MRHPVRAFEPGLSQLRKGLSGYQRGGGKYELQGSVLPNTSLLAQAGVKSQVPSNFYTSVSNEGLPCQRLRGQGGNRAKYCSQATRPHGDLPETIRLYHTRSFYYPIREISIDRPPGGGMPLSGLTRVGTSA